MVRKGEKMSSFEASASVFGVPVRIDGDEDFRARFRFQSLLQDYQELLQETEARKKKLQTDKQKRLRLLAEVKFLRAKRISLLENPSQKMQYKFKKPCRDNQSKSFNVGRSSNSHVQNKLPTKETNHRVVEDTKPSTSAWLDLNQVSLPDSEDMDKFQFQWDQQKVAEKSAKHPQNEVSGIDLKLSICRNVGNNSNALGKRKVTWEDQLVLRV